MTLLEEAELVVCDLECMACTHRVAMALPGDANARETLESLFCPGCNRRGQLLLVPSVSHQPSKDPDEGDRT